MSENDRPLPTPPRSRFGRESRDEPGSAPPLTSDRMALAAAEGRLDEFLQRELPEGEHARTLAMMMMGMSGMMPTPPIPEHPPGSTPPPPPVESEPRAAGLPPEALPDSAAAVPPEVLAAIREADVAGLTGLLRTEHARRCGADPSGGPGPAQLPAADEAPAQAASAAASPGRPGIDRAIVDELMRIAADNDVTVDWLTLRAIRLYVEDYRRTGRL